MHELLSSIRKFFSLFLFSNIDACLLYSSRINDTFHENLRKYISWKSVIREEDFVDVISNQQRENWWSPGGGWWTVILFTNRVSPKEGRKFLSRQFLEEIFSDEKPRRSGIVHLSLSDRTDEFSIRQTFSQARVVGTAIHGAPSIRSSIIIKRIT